MLSSPSQPTSRYRRDLTHVSSASYVGVASTEQADGKEVAKQIIIFPAELSGAAEGSVLTDPPGATTHSRMTNGSVSRPAESHSRMTNGTVQKGGGTILVVQYQDGSKTISVPPNVPVVEVAPEQVAFATGDVVYAATEKLPNGTLMTNKILLIAAAASPNTKQYGIRSMSHSALPDCEPNSTSTLPEQPGVLVVRKHHFLVLWSHWLNVPILLGLILSGISIYWASPVYQHKPDPNTGNFDVAADIGIWICAHVPGLHHYSSPPDWVYNHMSLGPGMLASALRLHWLCAYLLMRNGAVYVAGLVAGGGGRGFLPRWTDLRDVFKMFRYYAGFPLAKLTRRRWLHPSFSTKYNALQRAAYFSVPIAGFLSVATGWAIHKPMPFHWLAALFGRYNARRG